MPLLCLYIFKFRLKEIHFLLGHTEGSNSGLLLLFFGLLEYKRQLSTLREEESPVAISDSECVPSTCCCR